MFDLPDVRPASHVFYLLPGMRPAYSGVMKKIWNGSLLILGLAAAGCGNPSVETGAYDRDAGTRAESAESGTPSSLFEVTFGGGEAEITKNLPADAADQVGKAVKSLQGKSQPDISE
jgi:hypothetical protein